MGGMRDENTLLASCYQKSLKLALERKIRTIAFPGISTGVYGFPKDLAALIALTETKRFLKNNSFPKKVFFVAFEEASFKVYQSLLHL